MSTIFKTAEGVRIALRKRYEGTDWAHFEELADATGARHSGWCDFVAMNLWPSRGLEIVGHEIKVSRTDWLKELKSPSKAESFVRFCDRWYLVVGDPEIVKPGELPATWGLMVPHGGKLRVAKEAMRRDTQPVTRLFVAACCRAASRKKEFLPQDVADRIDAAYSDGEAAATERGRRAIESAQKGAAHWEECCKKLTQQITNFSQQTGIHLGNSWNHEQVSAAVARLMRGDLSVLLETQEEIQKACLSLKTISEVMQREHDELACVIQRRKAEGGAA